MATPTTTVDGAWTPNGRERHVLYEPEGFGEMEYGVVGPASRRVVRVERGAWGLTRASGKEMVNTSAGCMDGRGAVCHGAATWAEGRCAVFVAVARSAKRETCLRDGGVNTSALEHWHLPASVANSADAQADAQAAVTQDPVPRSPCPAAMTWPPPSA